jgi:hypothetical protein
MSENKKERQLSTRYPDDVYQAIKVLADKHDRSFNGEVIHALRFYIEGQKQPGDLLLSQLPKTLKVDDDDIAIIYFAGHGRKAYTVDRLLLELAKLTDKDMQELLRQRLEAINAQIAESSKPSITQEEVKTNEEKEQ